MLSLQINGENCDLGNDFSFTMNLKSPIFSSDTGSASYPFKIPNTERNARLMGFKHRVENTGDVYQTAQGTFLWNDKILFQGTLKMKILNSEKFEGALYEGSGDFNYLRKNTSLQQIDFGSLTFASPNAAEVFIDDGKDMIYPERNVAFPQFQNEVYYDPPSEDPEQWMVNWYVNSGVILQRLPISLNYALITPMLYLRFVLNKIFLFLSYTVTYDFFSKYPDFNKCVIYNSVNWNEDPATNYFEYQMTELLYNYHLPRIELNDLFSSLENFFNIRFFVNTLTRTIRILSVDDIIKSSTYIDFSKNIISINTELDEKIRGFNLKMTSDSGDSYLTSSIEYESQLISSIKKSVQKFSDLPVWPGTEETEYRYVINDQIWYKITKATKTWLPYSYTGEINLDSQSIIKENDQQIESKFSGVYMPFTDNVKIGNKRDEWSAIAPRLMFAMRRLDPDYVVATNSGENLNLTLGGNNGLYIKYYKAYLDFIFSAKLIKISKQMTFTELQDFDFSCKYMVGGIKYLIKSIQVNFKPDRIMPATIEAYPVN